MYQHMLPVSTIIGINFDKTISNFLHLISAKNLFFNIKNLPKLPSKDLDNYKITSVENLSFLLMHNLNKKNINV